MSRYNSNGGQTSPSFSAIFKNPVATYTDIASTYPSPLINWTVRTIDDGKLYEYDGTTWVWIDTLNTSVYDTLVQSMNNNVSQIGILSGIGGFVEKANKDDLLSHSAEIATETVKGHVEFATNAEVTTGTSSILAVHPVGLKGELDKKLTASIDIAKLKKSSSTYTDNDTSQTFIDAFCTADSLITIVITSVTLPLGIWVVNSAIGSFTITSSVNESADITFDYYIQKVV